MKLHFPGKLLFFAVALFHLTGLVSCRKPEIPTQSTYTFTNQTGSRITFDLYSDERDYYQNENRLQQYVIDAGASQNMVLDVARTYWVDWYSADYRYNNWANIFSVADPAPKLQVAMVDDKRSIRATVPDTLRSVMLNGSGASSAWKGTVTNSAPINGTHEFIFSKDFSGKYTYTDMNGAASIRQFKYSFNGFAQQGSTLLRFSMALRDAMDLNFYNVSCNLSNYFPLTGRDSLLVTAASGSSSTQFFVRRQ